MKYTKPTVVKSNTEGIKPRGSCFVYSCENSFSCKAAKGFGCTFFS